MSTKRNRHSLVLLACASLCALQFARDASADSPEDPPSAAAVAHTQEERDLLVLAENQWRSLDYDLLIATAEKVLQLPHVSHGAKIEALRLRGSAQVVLEEIDAATKTFEQIFELDSGYELPENTSPRILAIFKPAKAGWEVRQFEHLASELSVAMRTLAIDVDLPNKAKGGRSLKIGLSLKDSANIADIVLVSYRRRGQRSYTTLSAPAEEGTRTITIPAEITASALDYTMELVVRVRHRSGLLLRTIGSEERPLVVAVQHGEVPKPTPITKRWWFWAGAAGLATVAIAIPILVRNSADVGTEKVAIKWAP